jgi:hypothetical protein
VPVARSNIRVYTDFVVPFFYNAVHAWTSQAIPDLDSYQATIFGAAVTRRSLVVCLRA